MATPSATASPPKRRLRRGLVTILVIAGALWILFFDSHSLVQRILWHREAAQLHAENAALQEQIDALEARLDTPLSDEVIEHIAREQYGMRRPGETVYRVETSR